MATIHWPKSPWKQASALLTLFLLTNFLFVCCVCPRASPFTPPSSILSEMPILPLKCSFSISVCDWRPAKKQRAEQVIDRPACCLWCICSARRHKQSALHFHTDTLNATQSSVVTLALKWFLSYPTPLWLCLFLTLSLVARNQQQKWIRKSLSLTALGTNSALSVSERTQVVLGWGQQLQPIPHFFVLSSKIHIQTVPSQKWFLPLHINVYSFMFICRAWCHAWSHYQTAPVFICCRFPPWHHLPIRNHLFPHRPLFPWWKPPSACLPPSVAAGAELRLVYVCQRWYIIIQVYKVKQTNPLVSRSLCAHDGSTVLVFITKYPSFMKADLVLHQIHTRVHTQLKDSAVNDKTHTLV